MIPQYCIFFSWQSDNIKAKKLLGKALKEVKKRLEEKGIAVDVEQGGGGCGFISIEDSVRMKIRRCDIFVGDVTPVGNVAHRDKLLPNANVMYEMGIATECITANRILAVAMNGEWKVENMPFDFNHYNMLRYDPQTGSQQLVDRICQLILETDDISRRENNRFFSRRVVDKNIASEKYLPDTFLEDSDAKEKARMFVAPHKMYPFVYDWAVALNFDSYNHKKILCGETASLKLNVKRWDIQNRTIDIEGLRTTIGGICVYLKKQVDKLNQDKNDGWRYSRKIEKLIDWLSLMNRQVLVVTSDAGQGKTNFVCDLVLNVLNADGIPYIFVNAYELSAEQLARSIASEYNFIGDYSLEGVLQKAERYCSQQLQYLIVVIDGLNEHPKQGLFKANLIRIVRALNEHPYIKVIMTCRSQFYIKNYQILQQLIASDIYELKLTERRRVWDNTETNEDRCLIERYEKHFSTKAPQWAGVRGSLLENPLLMRIFFQGYQNQDKSDLTHIDYVDLYERYYEQLCSQIQGVIEQEVHVANVNGMTTRIFEKIVVWMIDSDKFTNLQIDDVLNWALSEEERQCFTAFLNANLLLKIDVPEDGNGSREVLNFTFEQVRDYLVTRYLIDNIYSTDVEKFKALVDKYTLENNNLAEGTTMFLFLYAKNRGKADVLELLKGASWYNLTLINNILSIPDEQITREDVERVKAYMRSHPDDFVEELAYTHWSPIRNKNLNISALLDVLKEMGKEERDSYLESVWPSKSRQYPVSGEALVTKRGRFIAAVKDGIAKRSGGKDPERKALESLYGYLRMDGLYIPSIKKHPETSPYVIHSFDFYQYLMRVHKGKKAEFLAWAGVKKGYAKEMFSTIYDAIFSEAKDVEEMYADYYSNEYKDFEQFLSMHYSIPLAKVKKFVEVKGEEDYRLIEFDALSYGSNVVSELVLDDDMIVRMYNWLNWQDDEDKD